MTSYDGPVKCTILLKDPKNPDSRLAQFEHMDSSPVSKNELEDYGLAPETESLVDIGGERWQHKIPIGLSPLTWTFTNYSKDIPDRYWQRRVFAATYRTIGLLINMKHKATSDSNAFFRDEFTEDLNVFGGRANVLAQAVLYHPSNPAQFNGLTQWNDNHFFTPFGDILPAHLIDPDNYTEGERFPNGGLKQLSSQPMLHINMHEKKHIYGFRHNHVDDTSIMAPFAKSGYTQNRMWSDPDTATDGVINKKAFIWQPTDVLRWHENYEKRSIVLQWLYNMQARRVRGRFVKGVPYRVAV